VVTLAGDPNAVAERHCWCGQSAGADAI